MNYRSLFSRAWTIAWQHPMLWLGGLLVAPLIVGGDVNPFFQMLYDIKQNAFISSWVTESLPVTVFKTFSTLAEMGYVGAFFLYLLVVVLLIGVAWFAFIAQGALISGIDQLNRHQRLDLGKSVIQGFKTSPKLFAIIAINKAIIFFVLLVLSSPLVALALHSGETNSTAANVAVVAIILLALAIYAPLAVIVNLVSNYAACFAALYAYPIKASFQSGFKLFKRHWLESIEWGLILLLADIVAILIVVIFAHSLFQPAALQPFIMYGGRLWALTFLAIPFFITLMVIGWLGAFRQAIWVLLFEHFTANAPAAVISLISRFALTVLNFIGRTITGTRTEKQNDSSL